MRNGIQDNYQMNYDRMHNSEVNMENKTVYFDNFGKGFTENRYKKF